jgi:hypothetical protein
MEPGQWDMLVRSIARQADYDIAFIRDFVARIFEEVNDRQLAGAIMAAAEGDMDLACDFLRLDKEIESAGELSPALRPESDRLWIRLHELRNTP